MTYNLLFDPRWLVEHISEWGGIPHRELNTKIRYLKALCGGGVEYTRTILDILESESGNKRSFEQLVEGVGIERLRKVLHFMLYAPEFWERIKKNAKKHRSHFRARTAPFWCGYIMLNDHWVLQRASGFLPRK